MYMRKQIRIDFMENKWPKFRKNRIQIDMVIKTCKFHLQNGSNLFLEDFSGLSINLSSNFRISTSFYFLSENLSVVSTKHIKSLYKNFLTVLAIFTILWHSCTNPVFGAPYTYTIIYVVKLFTITANVGILGSK